MSQTNRNNLAHWNVPVWVPRPTALRGRAKPFDAKYVYSLAVNPKSRDPQISQTDADFKKIQSAESAKSADLFLHFPCCLPWPSIEVVEPQASRLLTIAGVL
jgi:hypothetical protein